MSARAGLLLAVAACSFPGTSPVTDADPNTPDAPGPADAPAVVDADPNAPDAPAVPDAAVDASAVPVCPAGYAAIPGLSTGSRYRFVSTEERWIDAELDCEDDPVGADLPAHLVVIDNITERGAIIDGPDGTANLNDQWIGETDLFLENVFIYVTPQVVVGIGVLSGNSSTKDCVRLKNTYAHEVRDCDEPNGYVCECDGVAADPGRYPNPPDGN
jgi:hypothetical protein